MGFPQNWQSFGVWK